MTGPCLGSSRRTLILGWPLVRPARVGNHFRERMPPSRTGPDAGPRQATLLRCLWKPFPPPASHPALLPPPFPGAMAQSVRRR